MHSRKEFWSKSTQQRRGAVFSALKSSICTDGKLIHSLDLDGYVINICGKAWSHLLSVPKNMYYNCLNAVKAKTEVKSKMPRSRSSKPAKAQAIAWFSRFAKLNGDRLPNKQAIRLPYGTTVKGLYGRYMKQIRIGQDYVSYSTFAVILNEHFPHVFIMTKVRTNVFFNKK